MKRNEMKRDNISPTGLFFTLCLLWLGAGTAQAQEGSLDSTAWLSSYLMTEVNYGHRHGLEHPTVTDFPHIIIGGTAQLGRGWSVAAELEYERFRMDGQWANNFRNNYTTNKLYINKQWSEAVNVKAGIIDVPVGTTNSGGPALTIYDPLDESTLMPMTWHEGGVAFWGQTKLFHYQAGGYIYTASPLKDSRLLGLALRGGITPAEGLDLSLSYFYGSSKEGMVQRFNPNLVTFRHLYHAAFDFAYQSDCWTIDGQYLMSDTRRNKAVGLEAGYDVAEAMGLKAYSIIPFARYDGYFHVEGASCNKWTLGLNTSLPLGFTFKAETGWENPSNASHMLSTDISIGWQGEF